MRRILSLCLLTLFLFGGPARALDAAFRGSEGFPTPDGAGAVIGSGWTSRNHNWVGMKYSGTALQCATWSQPTFSGISNPKAYLSFVMYAVGSADNGTTSWEFSYACDANTDFSNQTFTVAATWNSSATQNKNLLNQSPELSLTVSCASATVVTWKICRKGNDGTNDTSSTDAVITDWRTIY